MREAHYFLIDVITGKIVSEFTTDENEARKWYDWRDGALKGEKDLQICKTIYG